MKNPIKEIKSKIKLAKIWVIILWIIFVALIINSICLTYKVHKLEKQNYDWYEKSENKTCGSETCGGGESQKCGNH